jgi:hypothetical protein
MRKAIAKHGLRIFTACLLLLGTLLLSSTRAEAQSQVGNYNWKQVDQAKPALVDAMIPVKAALEQMPAGQSRDEASARLFYYVAIYESLEAGNTVEYSVIGSLDVLKDVNAGGTPTVTTDTTPAVTPAFRKVLFNDAVVILTQ